MKKYIYFLIISTILLAFTVSAKKSETFLVTKIIDGDTIKIEAGQIIRLICINTPERGEDGYEEASNYLKALILNKKIKIKKDISETDVYGRLLRYVYLNNKLVNELVVRNGYGVAYPYEPDKRLCPQILKAEQKAKKEHLGLWKNLAGTQFICTTNAYNCKDFTKQSEAQYVFDLCGGISNDIHKLDGNHDGTVCESLP